MAFNFGKINSKPAGTTNEVKTQTPTADAKDYSNKAVSEILAKRESPKAVSDAINNNPTLRNFLQQNSMDINQKTLKQMPGADIGSYLATNGKEGLNIFMEDYPTAKDLEKALNEHKIEPREKEVDSYVAEQIALGKNLSKDEYLNSVNAQPITKKSKEQKEAEKLIREKELDEKNETIRQNAVNKILDANKKISDVAGADILKANGINAESFSPEITPFGVEIKFDMEGLLGNKEKTSEYMNKLREVLNDLGIKGDVGANPTTGKGKITIKNGNNDDDEIIDDEEEVFYDDIDGYSEGFTREQIENMKREKEKDKWGEY